MELGRGEIQSFVREIDDLAHVFLLGKSSLKRTHVQRKGDD
jgi:hypothetical protein